MDQFSDEHKARVLGNLASLSEQEQKEISNKEFLRAKEEHERFVAAFEKNQCYLCRRSVSSFDESIPCIHWLLKPTGLKKKHIFLVPEKYGFFQIQSLLRWYATQDSFGKNINNIPEEGTGNKLIELTIKYNEIEWSFSCGRSDLLGHENAKDGSQPHYHFQMRVSDRSYVRFNETHFPFSKYDLFKIEAIQAGLIHDSNSFGIGMHEVLNAENPEDFIGSQSQSGSEENAPLIIDSFVCADEGETIKVEDVYNLLKEAEDSGVTASSLLHKLPKTTKTVEISRGPGVVDQAPRTPRKMKS